MAIITAQKVKDIMQISGYSKDNLINTLIPPFQDWLVEYLQNWFHTSKYISNSTIAFVHSDSAVDTITDSESGFVTASFVNSMDIHVSDSTDNDGVYAVDTTVAGTLTLADGEEVVSEAAGAGVVIYRMNFPRGLWVPTAKCIYFDMQKRDPALKSKSLADYSETYAMP